MDFVFVERIHNKDCNPVETKAGAFIHRLSEFSSVYIKSYIFPLYS